MLLIKKDIIILFIIIDDCTRATWVYLLQSKSDVKTILPTFFSMVQTQFGVSIKSFQSDNAHELSFIEFFKSKRVTHFDSYVETPEKNSMVEQKH